MAANSSFLLGIKEYCKKYGKQYNILPSVIAMMAILNSGNGLSPLMPINNLYRLRAEDDWHRKCYSMSTNKIYSCVKEAKENELGSILFRVYDNLEQSVEDWCKYLATTRRNKMDYGPLKYSNVIGCDDYNKLIDFLVYDGYLTDQLGMRYNDINYTNTMRDTIVQYNLLKLDI